MNSAFVHDFSKAWAQRLLSDGAGERDAVRKAYRTVYGRDPEPGELDRAATYLAQARASLSKPGATDVSKQALASYLRVLAASNEFLFLE